MCKKASVCHQKLQDDLRSLEGLALDIDNKNKEYERVIEALVQFTNRYMYMNAVILVLLTSGNVVSGGQA